MKNDVFFFSNPFGFGPSSRIGILMNVSKAMWKNSRIHYVASNECSEILSNNGIHIISANQRNTNEIREILFSYKNPYVISSLNRFAIKIAHEQKYPNCFVDGLAWMWNKIPQDYLLTDMYFALNFPGIDEKIKNHPKLIRTPYFIDTLISTDYIESEVLINIGGCMNPLTSRLPTAFLKILAIAISTFNNKDIVLCGGREAMNFIKQYLPNNKCVTLKKDLFLATLLHTKHFITTSGLNATLEAFYYKVPVSFLMPINLSQYKILKVLHSFDVVTQKITWEDIIEQSLAINNSSEKSTILLFEEIANQILDNKILLNKTVHKIHDLFKIPTVNKKQKQFITNLGTNGAEFIAKTLLKQWGL